MKLAKKSQAGKNIIGRQERIQAAIPSKKGGSSLADIDTDLENLFLFTQGRVRFGTGVDNARGENISGEFQVFTSDAVADTEFTIEHGLDTLPIGWIVVKQDKAGSLYEGGTAWNETTSNFKCDVASVTFTIFLLK